MGEQSEKRSGSPSLNVSRLNRDGLRRGTPAPLFELPRVDGGELSVIDYRGKHVLLVFSDPSCLPCNELAPRLEELHRENDELHLIMVSRGDLALNRAKVVEHGLTFPIVLQRHWDLSREYGIFATPSAYLIDENGIISANVASGTTEILSLAGHRRRKMREELQVRLDELERELTKGQRELYRVEQEQAFLRESILRIGGAIQVLRELLASVHPTGEVEAEQKEVRSAAG